MMNRLLVVVAAIALVSGSFPLAAQTRPDLSGTWVVQSVDQQRPQADNGDGDRRRAGGGGGGFGGRGGFGGGRRGGGGFGGGGGARNGGAGGGGRGLLGDNYQQEDRITITQAEDSLIVTNLNLGRMSRYTFDGKESSNPGPGDSKIKSKAHWDGASFVVESTVTATNPRGDTGGREINIDTRQIWSLNPDGTLRLENRTKAPRGNITTTVTFRKS